jgi:type II secretion system protein G
MTTRSHHRGFTLIELLVVISIIGLLSGLTISIASIVRSRAKINAAVANIQKFDLAINNYYNDMQRYPLTPEGGKGSVSVYKALTGDLNLNKIYDPDDGDIPRNHPRWRKPYVSVRSKDVDALGNLLDPWNRPFRYLENETEAPQCAANPNSFLLYSLGPDGKATDGTREELIDFTLPNNKDNIQNWRSE